MRTYDFSPLWRSTIGFDRLFDLAETAQRAGEDNYPPYNIERLAEDRYQISLAVAGFSRRRDCDHGRAERGHDRRQQGREGRARISLPGHLDAPLQAPVQPGRPCAGEERLVRQTACCGSNWFREVPEAMKPRRIAINGTAPGNVQQIEAKAA